MIELYEGIAETGVPVVGGDLTSSDAVMLSVTALGRSERVPGRGGARPGDLLVVTGPLGRAGAAFRERSYVRFPMRLAEGKQLARDRARDARHLRRDRRRRGPSARRSGVRCVVELRRCRLLRARPSPIWRTARTTSSSRRSPTRTALRSSAASRRARVWSSCSTAARTCSAAGSTSPEGQCEAERLGVVLARTGADHGLAQLAAAEHRHRRQRQHVVAAGADRVRVDVEPHELDVSQLGGELLERGLDLRHGRTTAPRSPRPPGFGERSTSASNVSSVTARIGAHATGARRSSGTRQIASSTIVRLIFEWPAVRSAKAIGTSTMRKPARLRAVRRLDLKRVAPRVDRVERDRLEHARAGST